MPVNKAKRMDDGRIVRAQARSCAAIVTEQAINREIEELKRVSTNSEKFSAQVQGELAVIRDRIRRRRLQILKRGKR